MKDETIFFYLNKELNKDEQAEVEIWITQNPEQYKRIKMIWEGSEMDTTTSQPDLKSAWDKINSCTDSNSENQLLKKTIPYKKLLRYAAILIIGLGLGATGYITYQRISHTEWIEYESSLTNIKNITLPDGSIVTLNKDSELRYKKQLSSKNRVINLRGEAYFQVKKNPGRPFLVFSGNTIIKVLGTSFNVDAKDINGNVVVAVKSGKVAFYEKGNKDNNILLNEGEMGYYALQDMKLQKAQIHNNNFLAWKTKTLLFKDTPLDEVCEVLSQYYDTSIIILQPDLHKKKLTARYQAKTLDEVLNLLNITLDIQNKNTNHKIVLMIK